MNLIKTGKDVGLSVRNNGSQDVTILINHEEKNTHAADVLKVGLQVGEEIVVFVKDPESASKGRVVAQKRRLGEWVYEGKIK